MTVFTGSCGVGNGRRHSCLRCLLRCGHFETADNTFCGSVCYISTDDLIMQAITDRYGDGEAAVMAVNAGVDLLCTSSYRAQYEAVLEAVKAGRISYEALTDSVARILCWKNQLGLL